MLPALVIGGGVVFVIGGAVALAGVKNLKRRQRVMETPTSAISQAPGAGLVEIKGRVVAGEQGFVVAPFSGRQSVWVRATVQEYRSRGRSGTWVTVVDESDARPFLVDDGSGQLARVLPAGANVIVDETQVAKSRTFNDPSPGLQSYLAARGIQFTNFLGLNKSMLYKEQVLAPGDPVYALGPSRRDAGPPVNDGYRMSPSSQLVLSANPGAGQELLLTNKSEEQLVSKLLWGFVGGIVAASVGAVLVAWGLVAG